MIKIELLKLWLKDLDKETRLWFLLFVVGSCLVSVIVFQEVRYSSLRKEKNKEITKEKEKTVSCYETQIIYLQNEKREFMLLLEKYENLKYQVKLKK